MSMQLTSDTRLLVLTHRSSLCLYYDCFYTIATLLTETLNFNYWSHAGSEAYRVLSSYIIWKCC